MASIRPYSGGYRAFIKHKGWRETATFKTKREAQAWAEARMVELRATTEGTLGNLKTLGDAFKRYAEEVSPTHKGERWEVIRLEALREFLPITLPLSKIRAEHIEDFRDNRLRMVQAGTVIRDMGLLGSVLSYARRDWKWMQHDPMKDVRRPKTPKHRDRTISRSEIKTMCRIMGYRTNEMPTSKTVMAAYAFLLALRTGMRAGEICGMKWVHVHTSWVHLPSTKNGTARDVPVGAKGMRLLKALRGLDNEHVLPITTQTLDATIRKARAKGGLSGFTFHDTRHTAATRIGATVGQPGRLSFPEFCAVFGWKSANFALVYVNPSAATLAGKL